MVSLQVSDQFRHGDGSLLPLWHFRTERTKRKQVTTLCWNPNYPDLFAVAYGSYDFMRQGSGMVCCFSLKNTSHPEYIFSTESGVTCLDFHQHHQSLLAVGCYDGTVMVFDVRSKVNLPIYSSSIRTGKHTDPVWQVHWQVWGNTSMRYADDNRKCWSISSKTEQDKAKNCSCCMTWHDMT